LPNDNASVLEWLVGEALTVKQFATLKRHLEKRLTRQ
jgi:hypothetical protein